MLRIPLLIFSTKIEDKGGRKKPKWFSLRHWFPLKLNSKLPKSSSAKFIYVVVSGDNQCIPAVHTAVAELQKSSDTLMENLKESIDVLDEIIKMVPESNLKNAFKACLVNINAINALVQITIGATGEADLADIVKPHPGVVPTGQHSHLRMHHPLLSEIEKKFGGHLPSSTQSKPLGSQDDDEQYVEEGDTEP